MSAPRVAVKKATHLARSVPPHPSNATDAAHSTVPGESRNLDELSLIGLSHHGPLEPEASASFTTLQGQTDNLRPCALGLPQVALISKEDRRTRRPLAAQQEEGDIYSNPPHHQGAAARGPMEAFRDDLQHNSSKPAWDIKTTDTRCHLNSQTSVDNSGGASSNHADVMSDYLIRVPVAALDSGQARDNRTKGDSKIEAPMDRSRPFDDPGLCHVPDVFFCYAFIARFFGIIRKACVGMPLEMYRFEVRETQARRVRLHEMKRI